VDDVTKWSGCSTRAAADVVVVLFVGALQVPVTGVWAGWGLVGVAQCCHRQLWQCKGAYEAAIRFSKPAPTRFPSFPASSMASSCSMLLFRCFPEVLAWPFWPFSLSFSTSGAGFSPFWVGASV
jgi:hypothetical protein